MTLALLRVDDDTWTEASLVQTDPIVRPTVGTVLSTIDLDRALPPPRILDHLCCVQEPDLLEDYLTDQIRGDNTASFGCAHCSYWGL